MKNRGCGNGIGHPSITVARLAPALGLLATIAGGAAAQGDPAPRVDASPAAVARPRIAVDDRAAVYPVLIDPWVQRGELVAEDGGPSDEFGEAVDFDGETAVIGAPDADQAHGAVYVFRREGDGWTQVQKLVATDSELDDGFGASVAIDGGTLLVGAPFAGGDTDSDQGAVYVFTANNGTWEPEAKLTASAAAALDRFGGAVALAGDTALVAAERADGPGEDRGAVHVFVRDGTSWDEDDTLVAPDGGDDDVFGSSLAFAGDTAVIGAEGADVGQNEDQGAAYVFTRVLGGWSAPVTLLAGDGQAEEEFGVAVAIAGDTALVGAYLADVADGGDSGAAYVFTRNGDQWDEQQKLISSESADNLRFGQEVQLMGDVAIVGSPFHGAVYVFNRIGQTWSEQQVLTPEGGLELGGSPGRFGDSLALSADTLLVGAPGTDVGEGAGQGVVVDFHHQLPPTIEVDPQSLTITVAPGQSATVTLTISNSGEGTLNWALVDENACALPDWLRIDPAQGEVPGGDAQEVDVAVDSAGLSPGDHEADLCIQSDDPATPELVVPVLLTVTPETGVFTPVALAADPRPLASLSDGNGLFEPGERVEVAPAWRNDGTFAQLLLGTAAAFHGPSGPTYTLVDGEAEYGDVEPQATSSCLDLEDCYEMEITPAGVPRPAIHWDTTFDEELTDQSAGTWALHVGASFADVPRESPFYPAIETLLHHGVSGEPALARHDLRLFGCGDGLFCPLAPHTRAQAAVFLLEAASPGAMPEPCVDGQERFADVPFDSPYCPWIEELARRGISAGCGGGEAYCPGATIRRGQVAVLLLRAALGPTYTPQACTGMLADVPCDSLFAEWIEDLLARGITSGCATDPLRYCPAAPVARQQMAAFVTRAFGLTLYGP